MQALHTLNLVAHRFKNIMRGVAFADLQPFEKIRALKILVLYRFGKEFSFDRFDDGLRREILHAGVGF